MKKELSVGLTVFAALLQLTPYPAVAVTPKPYCSVASNSGGSWHTWTVSSQQEACYIAFFKVLGFGQSVDRAWRGSYTTGLNKAELSCNQGKKTVYGNDTQVFTNAVNMSNQLNWKGCIIKVL